MHQPFIGSTKQNPFLLTWLRLGCKEQPLLRGSSLKHQPQGKASLTLSCQGNECAALAGIINPWLAIKGSVVCSTLGCIYAEVSKLRKSLQLRCVWYFCFSLDILCLNHSCADEHPDSWYHLERRGREVAEKQNTQLPFACPNSPFFPCLPELSRVQE